MHDAYAEISRPAASDAMAGDPRPANKDFAGGEDDQVASATRSGCAEQPVQAPRANWMRAKPSSRPRPICWPPTEARVDAKIAQLKQLQTQITALLGQRDEAQENADRRRW